MPIKASLQPSVKEILLHLVTQRGKSSHVKSSIRLAPSAELDEDGRKDHVGKDGEEKPALRLWLDHALCLPHGAQGFLSRGPTKHATARSQHEAAVRASST